MDQKESHFAQFSTRYTLRLDYSLALRRQRTPFCRFRGGFWARDLGYAGLLYQNTPRLTQPLPNKAVEERMISALVIRLITTQTSAADLSISLAP